MLHTTRSFTRCWSNTTLGTLIQFNNKQVSTAITENSGPNIYHLYTSSRSFTIVHDSYSICTSKIWDWEVRGLIFHNKEQSMTCLVKDAKIGYILRVTVGLVFLGKAQFLTCWYIRDRSKHQQNIFWKSWKMLILWAFIDFELFWGVPLFKWIHLQDCVRYKFDLFMTKQSYY